MAIFPTLTPSSRTFTPGEYPHSVFAGMSGVQNRVRNSNVMLSSQVRLTFAAITEVQMLSILTHYQGQQGTSVSFSLPSAIWNGVSDASDYQLTSYGWRYIEPPSVSDAMCADAYDVELTLETVPPEGTAIAGLDFFVFAKLAAGIGVALSQTDLVVTATLIPGVAGVPGIDASVSWALAAGSPAGGATASGLNATVLAFVYSESFANGLSEVVNVAFAPGAGLGDGGDPDSANVSLLLHMDGSNGSTTFADDSSNALTVVANGNAQVSTAESKFGDASCLLDGSGDYLSVAYNSVIDVIDGDFTIEAWLYTSVQRWVIGAGGGALAWNATDGIHWLIEIASNVVRFQYFDGSSNAVIASTNTFTLNAWQHVSVSRSGSTLYIGTNGDITSHAVADLTAPSANPVLWIGVVPGGAGSTSSHYNGYIDDLRITKGVARYTSNFTPPTEPFPDP